MLQENKPLEVATQKALGLCHSCVGDDALQAHNSISESEIKDLLDEVYGDPNDKKSVNRCWNTQKRFNELLASSFRRLSFEYGRHLETEGLSAAEVTERYGILSHLGERSDSVSNCGSTLEFWKPLDLSSPWKLHKANFCRDRLCPLCIQRRSLKIFAQLSDIMNHVDKDSYSFLFLTLTVPNCSGESLDSVCSRLLKSFTAFCRRKELKKVIKGYFRSLEVTFNHNPLSKSYCTFHPHLHVILAVSHSYFKKHYIRRDEWLSMWRESYGDDSIIMVDIRKIKPNAYTAEMLEDSGLLQIGFNKAVAETAKYSVKSSDYLFPKNPRLTDFAVKHLSRALRGLHLFAVGGLFSDISKSLNQEDVMSDSADLLHVTADDVINPALAYMIVRFRWGGNSYDLLSVTRSEYPN